jgi:hypothetical protein
MFGEDNPTFHENAIIVKQLPNKKTERTISCYTQKKSLFSDSSDEEDDGVVNPEQKPEVNTQSTREFCPYPPSLFSR